MPLVKTTASGFALSLMLCATSALAAPSDAPAPEQAASAPDDKDADKKDGLTLGGALTAVWQKAYGVPNGTVQSGDAFTSRADLTLDAPLPDLGGVEHKVFLHARAGQGPGVNEPLGRLGYFSVPNAAAFPASGDNAHATSAVLGEAWYQATVPVGQSQRKLELSAGKMDMFGFFDQNAVANDESTQFLNSLFVHNPLLDAGGEVGVDANGFQPGVVMAYRDESSASGPWRLALGVLSAKDNGRDFGAPLLIAQFDKTLKLLGDREGNYRFYVWTRSDAPDFTGDGARHTGFGLSIDQQVSDNLKLFGRYGQLTSGQALFDHALTLGTEIGGGLWGRADDAIGLAGAWLRPGSAYRGAGGEGYLNASSQDAGAPSFAFNPSGVEQTAELYYRFQPMPHLSISPDVQWIRRGGGNAQARNTTIIGVRANISF